MSPHRLDGLPLTKAVFERLDALYLDQLQELGDDDPTVKALDKVLDLLDCRSLDEPIEHQLSVFEETYQFAQEDVDGDPDDATPGGSP